MKHSLSTSYEPNPHHSFSIKIAQALKCCEMAIFLHHIEYWLNYNENAKVNFFEGRYWTYQTIEELSNHFPYWTEKNVRVIKDKLLKMGILIKGNFNKDKFDKTLWYSIDYGKLSQIIFAICPNGQIEAPIGADRNAQMGRSIYKDKDNRIEDNIYNINTACAEGEEKKKKSSIPENHKSYGQFVHMKPETYEKLCSNHTEKTVLEIFQKMDDHCVNNRPKGYTCYEAAFRQFLSNHRPNQKNYEPRYCEITTTFNQKIKFSFEDLMAKIVQERKNWTKEEIESAWSILSQHKQNVNDWWLFIDGTINNIRIKRQNHNQKEILCPIKLDPHAAYLRSKGTYSAKDMSEPILANFARQIGLSEPS